MYLNVYFLIYFIVNSNIHFLLLTKYVEKEPLPAASKQKV